MCVAENRVTLVFNIFCLDPRSREYKQLKLIHCLTNECRTLRCININTVCILSGLYFCERQRFQHLGFSGVGEHFL